MRRSTKYVAVAVGLIVLLVILCAVLRRTRKRTERLNVLVASDTCYCYPNSPRIVVLRITKKAETAIGSEYVPDGRLAERLRNIFATHAERVLYVFPESDAPSRRVVEVIDMVRHIQSGKEEISGMPKGLQSQPENMNIQVRLVTPDSIRAACPQNCFNWAVRGLPIAP